MESPQVPVRIETLLAHREWVRRVARVLVAGEDAADDLEQEVWVKALEQPPNVRGSIRGWLAAVLRNAFLNRQRSETRRARREEAVSRREPQPSTQDVVALGEAHRLVVNEVMNLAEPYRRTVLLRYFEDLAPAAIAKREEVPVETVRARLRRARATLRARLDAKAEGDRRAWCMALLALTRPEVSVGSGGLGIAGGVLMRTSSKLALSSLFAVAVLVGLALSWRASRPPEGAGDGGTRSADARPEEPSPVSMPGLAARPRGLAPGTQSRPDGPTAMSGRDVAVGIPTPRVTPDAQRLAGPAGEISGRVLRLVERTPVAGATVTVTGSGELPPGGKFPATLMATTGGQGEFRLGGFGPATYGLRAQMDGLVEEDFTAKVDAGAGVGGIEVLLGLGGGIEGRVADLRGGPAAGLSVHLAPREGRTGQATVTDAEGRYRFTTLTPTYYYVILARGGGQEQEGHVSVVEGQMARFDFLGTAALSGTLSGDGRAPMAGAQIAALPLTPAGEVRYGDGYSRLETTTDEQGRFRIEGFEPGGWLISVNARGKDRFHADVARRTLVAGENEMAIELDLAAEVAGRVSSQVTGKPLSSPEVSLSLVPIDPRNGDGWGWDNGASVAYAFADVEGRYRFRGLPPGRYRLVAAHGGDALWDLDLEVGAGEKKSGVEIVMEKARLGTVRFSVHDEAGKVVDRVYVGLVKNGLTTPISATNPELGIYVAELQAGSVRVSLLSSSGLGVELTIDVREGETERVDVTLQRKTEPSSGR